MTELQTVNADLQDISNFKPLEQTEKNEVSTIKKDINFDDSVSVIKFAETIQRDIAKFSDEVLQKVKIKDTGEAGKIIQNMLLEMEGFNMSKLPTDDSLLAKIPIIGDILFVSLKRFIGSLDTVEGKIEELIRLLEGQSNELQADITMLDSMYKENLELLRKLELYIIAGRDALLEVTNNSLLDLKTRAEKTKDPVDAQNYQDLKQQVERFEKRLHNLVLARAAAVQMAPQIRLAQEGDKMLIEDIRDVITHTIPIWKKQFIMVISNKRREKALRVTRGVKDATNKQLLSNAQTMEELTQQINENYQRGIIDLETLEEVNTRTISTIKNTLETQSKASQKRNEANQRLAAMENELKNTLLQSIETNIYSLFQRLFIDIILNLYIITGY